LLVKALHAKGYRNLDTTVGLCSPLAVLVGENNAGKSNVIDALRTVLEPEAGPRHRCWLRPEDFTHDGRGGDPLTGELELAVELDGLTNKEKGRMVTCLAPKAGSDAAKIRLKARIGSDGRMITQWYGGDSDHADLERARSRLTLALRLTRPTPFGKRGASAPFDTSLSCLIDTRCIGPRWFAPGRPGKTPTEMPARC